MNQVTVTLPDGSSRQLAAGSPVREVAASISPRLAEAALAAVVDDRLVDLSTPLVADARVRLVTDKSAEALALTRHSTAHLMAAAVTALFPGTQCGIGPAIDEGFFYDFVVGRPFVPEDLAAIEAKMRELAAADLPYERQLWPRDEALAFFASRGEPLKVQLIEEKTAGQSHVSVYLMGQYTDGPEESWFREQYAERGLRLDMGKSCVRFKRLDQVPLDVLGGAIERIPVGEFIARYEAARATPR